MLLAFGIIPLTLIGGALSWYSRSILSKQAFEHLVSVNQVKKQQLEEQLVEHKNDMQVLLDTVSLLRNKAKQQLLATQENKTAQLEAFFRERGDNITVLAQDEWVGQALEQFDGALEMSESVDSIAWKSVEGRLGNALREIKKEYDYHDLLLITKAGRVVFSARKDTDLGQNVYTSDLKDTRLRHMFQRTLTTGETYLALDEEQKQNIDNSHKHQYITIEDFFHYPPAGGQVFFLGAPLYRFGELTGVIALALSPSSNSPSSLNQIVQRRDGMGETGTSYLAALNQAGEVYYRNDAHSQDKYQWQVGDTLSNDEAMYLALQGEKGTLIHTSADNELVLSVHTPVNIQSLNWGLVSHIDLEEAITPMLESLREDYFTRYIEIRNYHDLFLVHPNGQVFYSVNHGDDYGSNLFTGAYAHTDLATTFKQAMKTRDFVRSDYALYEASGYIPSSFMGQPLMSANGDTIELVLLVQKSGKHIKQVMAERKGMGESGESYLVGEDKLMRSDTHLSPETHSLFASLQAPEVGRVDTDSVEAALSGISGEHLGENYRGDKVLSVYTPFEFGEHHWALISEMRQSEAFAEVEQLETLLLWLILGLLLLAWIFGRRISLGFVRPLWQLNQYLKTLAQGNIEQSQIHYQGQDEVTEILQASEQVKTALSHTIKQAHAIAAGDFSHDIRLLSEQDQLGHALQNMTTTLRGVIAQARNVAAGDYRLTVTILSDKDQLGTALRDMTHTLREITEKNAEALAQLEQENLKKQKNDWFKSGQTELIQTLGGEQTVQALGKNIISFLARYLDAQMGTFYLIHTLIDSTLDQSNEMDENTRLILVASYAYHKRKRMGQSWRLGEGLVGQVALEGEYVLLSDLPEHYHQVQSSLGSSLPHNLVIMPFFYENKLCGVLELGSLQDIDDEQLNFLQQVMPDIGTAVNAAASRARLAELLMQSQTQTEEMQTQTEEMQAQQEELRATNEELSIRSRELEQQKQDIKNKNTALQKTQQAIEIKAKELELANQYKSEFLANMSHELRTPLNSMLILSQMLADNRPNNLNEQQIESADTINKAGQELLALINDILDLSKVEAGKIDVYLEDFVLSDLTASLERNFKPLADKHEIAFSLHVDKTVPQQLNSDKQRLQQVLTNLLSNAFKFTSEKGQVSLEINTQAQTLYFKVCDTGIGIAPEKQASIFEAFKQADGSTTRNYGGTGLGLSISRQLAQLLEGDLQVQSQVNKGSCFTLSLPLHVVNKLNTSATPSPQTPPPVVDTPSVETLEKTAPPIQQETKTSICQDDRDNLASTDKVLLIIEDDVQFAQVVSKLAQERGFKILCANEGKSGLELAENYTPDAIILDIGLPLVDGWSVMAQLKDNPHTRHIPVYFISGNENRVEALNMGAIGYALKPVSMSTLNHTFEQIERVIAADKHYPLIFSQNHAQSIVELLQTAHTQPVVLNALDKIQAEIQTPAQYYDCYIIDASQDNAFLQQCLNACISIDKPALPPVLVYSQRDLNLEEQNLIKQAKLQYIIKVVQSQARLLDEATLFMHQHQNDLSDDKRAMLTRVHDKNAIFQNKKILLVDDDIRNVFSLGALLEEKDMEVLVAKDGQLALDLLAEHSDVDLVLMDVMMPNMDGYEAMRRIRKQGQFAKLPIIALTAKAMSHDRAKCIEAGANDYFSKPIDNDKLFSLMRVWLYK